jgi:hypothetical protein
MPEWFDIAKNDQGTIALKVPPNTESYVAQQMRRSDCEGVTLYTGLLILQTRLAALESILGPSEVGSVAGRATPAKLQARRTAIKRMGRVDRCRFGWRPDPRDNAKLLPDREEQETIGRARLLAAAGLSLREICRRLDQQGRGRRGKKWSPGGHGVLCSILAREGIRAAADSPSSPPLAGQVH